MGLFRKKNNTAVKNGEDIELIEHNSKAIKSLLVLCENEEYSAKLRDIEEELKYLTPSSSSEILKYDQKIKNCIEDLKIALTKNAEPNTKTAELFKDLKVLIAERNSNI